MTIPHLLDKLADHTDLTPGEAEFIFSTLMDGKLTPAQAGAFLLTLRSKGETAAEIAAAVRCALQRANLIEGIQGEYMDIVGTGGDNKQTFNCSTAAALTMAALGYQIVKHGNRAVSSSSGAADVLEKLGYPLDLDAAGLKRSLRQCNFAFAFARNAHPCFRHIAPIRKELGVCTLFNLLGPLINPSRPTHMIMGVAKPDLVPTIAHVLAQGNYRRAIVICGKGGYDEATCFGSPTALLIEGTQITDYIISPAELGFQPPVEEAELQVHTPEEAAAVLTCVLQGKGPKAMMDMVALNVAIAINLFAPELPLQACAARARAAIAQGLGINIVNRWQKP